ncbi:hypothetical protein BGZ99_004654 [Dissophora globulifera]|uniref:Uncharacterized protein n=1 Tax=Dissophora globulifera TaxID=979702 RepID=A0A9P6UUJ3_9FUNG|nr:hypothetical protein BGZ99_004654 [Dissophora globulifera]
MQSPERQQRQWQQYNWPDSKRSTFIHTHQHHIDIINNNNSSSSSSNTHNIGRICLGIVFLTHQLMYKSRRLDRAVGRSEMRLLFLTFIWIQVLQMFTIGGIFSSSRTAMIWTSALELGAIACFFWILLVNVFIRMESLFFILLTSAAIMGGTTFLALDLAMDITRHHDGHSAELYVLTLIFPASAAVLFALLACTLVLRRLDTYKSIGKSSHSPHSLE